MKRRRQVDVHNVVDASLIADRLSVARKTVHVWRERHPEFPAPIQTLRIGPVWNMAEVYEWYRRRNSIR